MKIRPLVCLYGALIALGLSGSASSAQQAGLQLGIALSDSLLSSGETLTARVQVANPGGGGAADFYFAILLPDGSTIVSTGPGVGARFGQFADLRTLVPVASGVGLGAPFDYHNDAFFTYTFNGSEPPGVYRVYFAALTAGALSDGVIGGGELIALATSEFAVSAPVTAVVDTSRTASDVVPSSGGEVATTSSTGIGFTLSVPSGAVSAPTTITIAPLISVSNLPGDASFAFGLRAEPSGLTFDVPATLTMTLPPGMPLSPRGYAALVTSEQGQRIDLVPVAVTDRTLTVTITHFSEVVITNEVQLYCQPAVTPEMATACTLIAAALDLAGSIEDPTFKDYVLQVALPDWYEAGIRGRMSRLTADEPGPGGNIDALLDVTYSEWLAWVAFYELAAGQIVVSDPGRPLSTQIQDAYASLTFGNDFGQERANARCLADRPNAVAYVRRVWTLDTYFRGAFHEPPLGGTEYCLRVAIDAAPPPALTPGVPTTMPVDVRMRFSDNAEAIGLNVQALLTITATSATVTPAGGTVALPLAQNVTLTPTAASSVVTITAAVAEPALLSYLPPITRTLNAGAVAGTVAATQLRILDPLNVTDIRYNDTAPLVANGQVERMVSEAGITAVARRHVSIDASTLQVHGSIDRQESVQNLEQFGVLSEANIVLDLQSSTTYRVIVSYDLLRREGSGSTSVRLQVSSALDIVESLAADESSRSDTYSRMVTLPPGVHGVTVEVSQSRGATQELQSHRVGATMTLTRVSPSP